jgi:hypothetical protein
MDRPGRRGLLDQLLQLLGREAAFRERRAVAENAKDGIRARREEPHERRHHLRKGEQDGRNEKGVPLRAAQGERLGDELAEHERQIRDDRDGEREREPVGVIPDDGNTAQEGLDVSGEAPPAERAGRRADDGDADLHRGEEAFGERAERRQALRRAGPLLEELIEPRPSHADDGDLGARQEAVGEREHEDHQKLENVFSPSEVRGETLSGPLGAHSVEGLRTNRFA